MNTKRKGINAERELLHKFWAIGWSCIRVAGSGSMHYPSPDLLAGNRIRKIAIECKCINNGSFYFEKKEIDDLKEFCNRFGAEPWIAIKFGESELKDWLFFMLEDLKETEKGYSVTAELGKMKGLLFEEVVKTAGNSFK